MNKRLSLKKETLVSLDNEELTGVVGGTVATFTCGLTNGNSCTVCVNSVYCPTYTCNATDIVTELPRTIG